MEEIVRKRGRPRKESSRKNRVQCKMTDDEYEMLRYLCDSQGKTMTDVLLGGVRTSYNLAKYKEK